MKPTNWNQSVIALTIFIAFSPVVNSVHPFFSRFTMTVGNANSVIREKTKQVAAFNIPIIAIYYQDIMQIWYSTQASAVTPLAAVWGHESNFFL